MTIRKGICTTVIGTLGLFALVYLGLSAYEAIWLHLHRPPTTPDGVWPDPVTSFPPSWALITSFNPALKCGIYGSPIVAVIVAIVAWRDHVKVKKESEHPREPYL